MRQIEKSNFTAVCSARWQKQFLWIFVLIKTFESKAEMEWIFRYIRFLSLSFLFLDKTTKDKCSYSHWSVNTLSVRPRQKIIMVEKKCIRRQATQKEILYIFFFFFSFYKFKRGKKELQHNRLSFLFDMTIIQVTLIDYLRITFNGNGRDFR